MVFELAVETGNFEDFAKDTDSVDEVGERGKYNLLWSESCIVVLLESVWVRNLLYKISTHEVKGTSTLEE